MSIITELTELRSMIERIEERIGHFYMFIELSHPNAKMPTVAYKGDAGWDLYSCEDVYIIKNERFFIPIGIKTEFPPGYVCLVRDRGSTTETHFCVAGVIDSGFRGEWLVQVIAREDHLIKVGDKIAQFLILPVYNGLNVCQVNNNKIEENSERGEKMLGSSNEHKNCYQCKYYKLMISNGEHSHICVHHSLPYGKLLKCGYSGGFGIPDDCPLR
ncbi:MAG: hypothetical protein ACOC56_00180 [Atribacterota bacterium]